ncbi:hypothetical protein AB0C45_03665 [Streptomyces cyaneofuscatus]|uniref:hypothetical protein n=1 Tax=Streptomyces cyaneofuscatus TaxID=66883 RepID=UPI0033F66979
MAELGQAVTRLDRILVRLVDIAELREWQPPFPDLAAAITQAKQVRGRQKAPVGDFGADRAHLRRMALAAAEILARLTDDEEASDVSSS